MKACYWLGIGNLQTEYGTEPSEELMRELDGDVIELNEELISYMIADGSENEYVFETDPAAFTWNWLCAVMRMEPLENDFLERAEQAIRNGFAEKHKAEKRRAEFRAKYC